MERIKDLLIGIYADAYEWITRVILGMNKVVVKRSNNAISLRSRAHVKNVFVEVRDLRGQNLLGNKHKWFPHIDPRWSRITFTLPETDLYMPNIVYVRVTYEAANKPDKWFGSHTTEHFKCTLYKTARISGENTTF